MNRILMATLLGAVSIMLLAGLGLVEAPTAATGNPVGLPQIAADAPRADTPRECSTADNVHTACTYQ